MRDLTRRLLAGDTRALARAISMVEEGGEAGQEVTRATFAHAGSAYVVGVTGVPGAGKSTLVDGLAALYRQRGERVGVVAVDPSSAFSGGALLGDRIRMQRHSTDPGVFIRSMATRQHLGGLAEATPAVVDLLDAAGHKRILIETVGVGQDEIEIVQAAHTVIVVSAPGLGDDIQAIKAGILEIADIHVVSKADKPEANDAVRVLRAMLNLDPSIHEKKGWRVPICPTSALSGEGLGELFIAIDRHRAHLRESGEIDFRRRRIAEMRILKTAENIVRAEFAYRRNGALAAVLDRVVAREMDPFSAANDLLASLGQGGNDGNTE